MYIPPAFHHFNPNADEEFDATDIVKLLEFPMTPEEEQLLFPAADNHYYWNDIPTLKSEMLKHLPTHHNTRKIFQDDELLREHVSFMEFRQPKTRLCKAYRAVTAYLEAKNWSHSTIHVNFARGLIDCAPMHLGFHTLAIPEWCYCPLALPSWCQKYQIGQLEQSFCKKCHQKAPRAFLDHVKSMKRRPIGNEPDRPVVIEELHYLLFVFLHAYYEHYLVHWKRHDAFYPKDSPDCKLVVGRKWARMLRYRELGLQRQEQLRRETLEHQKKLEQMQKVREKLQEILVREEIELREMRDAVFDRAQEVLGIRTDKKTAKERQPYTTVSYAASKMKCGGKIQNILVDHYVARDSKKEYKKVCFVDSSFKQMELLWKNRTHPVLFEDSINQLTESFFLGMDASPSEGKKVTLYNIKVRIRLIIVHPVAGNDTIEKAKDEGGPTRQFLSEFWRYLPRIEIQAKLTNGNDKDFKLFEQKEYLQPKIDFQINLLQENDKSEVKRCYRAVGRVISFCILHEFHISHVVLSKIHRNYLLRGITPKDDEYDKTELFYDLKEIMGKEKDDNNYVFEALKAMGSDEETDFVAQLRQHVHDYYIDQYQIFLDAMQEGMRLGKFQLPLQKSTQALLTHFSFLCF
jgi:hypothetical protein